MTRNIHHAKPNNVPALLMRRDRVNLVSMEFVNSAYKTCMAKCRNRNGHISGMDNAVALKSNIQHPCIKKAVTNEDKDMHI